jgi:anaphase-promoting complex subunit 6
LARKYFNKANKLDKHFAPAWIAHGHAYSAQDESDPAMGAYRTASKLFPGCYQASLYTGMEYMRMNNMKTALLEFKQAQKLNPTDPNVLNEMGVVYYHQGEYDSARHHLAEALRICSELSDEAAHSETVEAISLNLGHCLRKLK